MQFRLMGETTNERQGDVLNGIPSTLLPNEVPFVRPSLRACSRCDAQRAIQRFYREFASRSHVRRDPQQRIPHGQVAHNFEGLRVGFKVFPGN